MSGDDRILVAKIEEENREACEAFFNKYIPIIHRSHRFSLPGANEHDVQDLTHDTCREILQEVKVYNPTYAVSTWVENICLRNRQRFLREQGRRRKQVPIAQELGGEEAAQLRLEAAVLEAQDPSPQSTLELKERCEIIHKFLGTLQSNEDRGVFFDREIFELSYEEIAAKHNVSLDSVKSRLRRVRLRWATFLKDHHGIE